jgi:hypothetical protein
VTPLRFEQMHEEEWAELESLLAAVHSTSTALTATRSALPGERIAALYRRSCEHLALARARSYPTYLVDRLERLTSTAHQVIYQRHEFGLGRVRYMLSVEFPAAVRAHAWYVAVSTLTFVVPTLVLGFLVYAYPELILSVVSAETASEFE